MSRLPLPNVAEPLPEHVQMQLRRLIPRDKKSYERLRSVANIIYKWYAPEGEDLFANVVKWYTLLLDFLENTDDSLSLETQIFLKKMCDPLMLAITRLYASDLPLSKEGCRVLVNLRDGLEREAEKGSPATKFLYGKSRQLCFEYITRYQAVNALKQYFDEEGWGFCEEAELADEPNIKEIAESLTRLRSFGVKPCVISDGLLHPRNLAWVFNDGYGLARQVDPDGKYGVIPPLAVTHLTDTKTIRGRLEPKTYKLDDEGALGVSLGFSPMMAASIHPDGQMTVDSDMALISVEKVFRDASAKDAYTLFQLVHLLRLFDLVVPVSEMRAQKLPAWPTTQGPRPKQGERVQQPWGSLVIPRLRILKNPELLEAALREEIREGKELTERLARRKHRVPGFLRPLADGCEASPNARKLAMEERGIPIPEGWTYVRDHDRGSREDDPIIGYKTRRRDL